MTQKRFIKLLMSKGFRRDTARGLSETVKFSNDFTCKENHTVKKNGNDFRMIPVTYESYYGVFVDLVSL